MTGPRSFRRRLAARIAVAVSLLLLAVSLLGYASLRVFLYRRLDATIVRLAQIEAAATADSRDESVHFHDAAFVEGGAGHDAILTRYAMFWTVQGQPVVRTKNLGGTDLPLPRSVRERAVADAAPVLFAFRWRGTSYRAVLYPLGVLGPLHAPHLLQVAAATAETDELLRQALALLVGLVVFGFGTGGALGWWLAGYALRPVLEIIGEAESFDLTLARHRIVARADTEEHRRLIAVLNTLLGRVDDALESQRRFVADAGHAIKTPLTILRGDLEVTERRVRSREEYQQVIRQAVADLREVSDLADDLITLARSDGGALQPLRVPVQVDELLARVAARFSGAADRAGLTLEVASGRGGEFAGDPVLLERAVGNLVDNAIKYGRSDGHVLLCCRRSESMIEICVSDDGPGIETSEHDLVSTRFYRGARDRGRVAGSGLGLCIAEGVARAHGGGLALAALPGGGLEARLQLAVKSPLSG